MTRHTWSGVRLTTNEELSRRRRADIRGRGGQSSGGVSHKDLVSLTTKRNCHTPLSRTASRSPKRSRSATRSCAKSASRATTCCLAASAPAASCASARCTPPRAAPWLSRTTPRARASGTSRRLSRSSARPRRLSRDSARATLSRATRARRGRSGASRRGRSGARGARSSAPSTRSTVSWIERGACVRHPQVFGDRSEASCKPLVSVFCWLCLGFVSPWLSRLDAVVRRAVHPRS